jgi:hypothetical protein
MEYVYVGRNELVALVVGPITGAIQVASPS